MKSLSLPLVSLFLCAHAHADVILEQKIELPSGGTIFNKKRIKGDRVRLDTTTPLTDKTYFLDKSGKMVAYDHKQKTAAVTTIADKEKAWAKEPKLKPVKPTGETEKIGSWNCEIWTSTAPNTTIKQWRTKDFPNFKGILEQMKVLASIPGMDLGFAETYPDALAVKTVATTPKGSFTVSVLKVSEETIPESEFAPPTGYQEIKTLSK